MSLQAPTLDEIQHAVALLRGRGRKVETIPGNKAGLYKIDAHLSTAHGVMRHAVMVGMKPQRPFGSPTEQQREE
ncbi:hypothetical protein [Methylobacterium sp. Leaf88]|uniref:hypothetical protein n=1 Tax=Methylobacterium sp. Leaf88 TaxID=1736244 RepID=UPI0006F5127C|nr:hypothetical protein [Methylobacterium sp. Leaf88]KQO73200.1 hypothetical protein ASF20_15865 [Methylobacterium sp. Leaf88]